MKPIQLLVFILAQWMLFNLVIIDGVYLHAIFDGSHVVLYGQFPLLSHLYVQ
jgi:hypothetical protein